MKSNKKIFFQLLFSFGITALIFFGLSIAQILIAENSYDWKHILIDYFSDILVLSAAFFVFYILLRKNLEKEQKLVQSEAQLRNFARHLNHVQEEERAHIAREIHDELSQQLAGIKINVSSLKKMKEGNGIDEHIQDTIKAVDDAMQSVRKIATELRPGILDSLGLIPSLEWLVREYEKKSGIKCRFIQNVKRQQFEKNLSTCFFRICQEALTNISKHAQASQVTAHVEQEDDELILTVSDNGKGIASEKLENPFSMGLLGMRERAESLGADLQIRSKKGSGTTIQLKAKVN